MQATRKAPKGLKRVPMYQTAKLVGWRSCQGQFKLT
ncbi:hypothetical protein IFY68_05816 (plasmid) [Klebsiella pneumoniae]|nr:hypothetical protein L445_05435 [Klebsiella pneumoniae BIDMC 16]EWE60764.1 hypothetical protein L442_05528 [Klebsiella pneumoniae BIDMC 13]EWE84584.1 hypothetical protein L434_10592 [Klebsiella pneumoniae BIDMC 7B]EWE84930.1 hypothetical protein L431_10318 [Klebsiella pneumoniae BIDMC 5]EWE99164.1 hypothetical protein L430_10313 [Klebsiella pneumoniae BIDMC 4]EWF00513.1 hypothetical protein L427_09950 [Klebsiella pneumoniae BIDMC 2A]EWF15018.1 hypothetical protein L412_05411 [Klebsiella pn